MDLGNIISAAQEYGDGREAEGAAAKAAGLAPVIADLTAQVETLTAKVKELAPVTPDPTPIPTPTPSPPGVFLPFTADSYFRTPATGRTIDQAKTTAFRAFVKARPEQQGHPAPRITGLGGNQWGTTTHVSQVGDPVWKIVSPRKETAILGSQGFHMADVVASRIPTGTQDRPFLIVDPIFGYSVFCADVVPNMAARTITVSNSAIFWHSSNGLDGRNPASNDPRNFNSRGRITDSMVIRPDVFAAALAAGTGLGYVLQMFSVETSTAAGFEHPMVGCESGKNGWGSEGVRIALDPAIDLTTRNLSPGALVIARTLQEHGAYIGDNSGSGCTLKGAQGSTAYDPYDGALKLDSLESGLTWDDFVVLAP